MNWTRGRVIAAVLALLAVAGGALVAVLVRDGGTGTRPTPSPSVATLASPFTGERVTSLRRVLTVKIDNVVYARPQTGLGDADIVYVVPVEGGLTRFLAVFSSRLPPVIGPVRSAREDDLELLRQFGRPAFAYSGAAPPLLPVVEHARTVDLYAGHAAGYFRSSARTAPYNLYARTSQLLAQAAGASTARDIGFRFGPPPAGGTAASSVGVSYPAAQYRFTWSAARGRWLVAIDGAQARTTDGGPLGAPTVVVQYTVVRTSRFLEYGHRPPYAESTGSGRALVLRNGKEYQAHWSRPSADGGTTFTAATGAPMTFARGPVWVLLAAR